MRISRLGLSLLAAATIAAPAAAQKACAVTEGTALAIAMDPIMVAPGGSRPVAVFEFSTYRPAESLPAGCRVEWSVLPAGAGAVVDGRLTVPASARPGGSFTLVARVGPGTARQTVHVIDPRPNPLAGYWSQAETDTAECAGAAGAVPRPEPIRELIIREDSLFSLTAVPFETRRDYWGTYSFDPATGALRFHVENGNNDVSDLQLAGRARAEGGTLRLEGFWLGDPMQPRAGRTCTYLFTRRN